jgi:membrane protein
MEWVARLPLVGPFIASLAGKIARTRAWRVYEQLDRRHWQRLAAAITYSSFIALFPLITAAAALSAAVLGSSEREKVREWIADQVPGIAGQIDFNAFFRSAGTVSLIALGALLITGVNWIGYVRESLRAVWDLDHEEENWFRGRAVDALLLLGLGGTLLASLTVSVGAATAARAVVGALGWGERSGAGVWLLTPAAYAAALAADFLVLGYTLTRLAGVRPARRDVVTAALIGAFGFELLKFLLSGYLSHVAGRNVYGAFGVPVALVLWLNFMSRLLLYCAGWTAAPDQLGERPAAVDDEGEQGQQGE